MKIFPALFLMSVLVGCSSVPPKTEAIHNALVTDSALRQASSQCALVDQESRRIAEKERLAWWQRNQKWVEAADFGILQLNWQDTPGNVEADRAILAMQLLEGIQADAKAQVNQAGAAE